MINFPLFPQSASNFAGEVDSLYFFILAVTSFFAILVVVLVAIFAVRFKRKREDEAGVPVHGALALELTWTAIPFVLAMVMFAWGTSVYFAMAKPPSNAMEIYAVGKRWMWKFQHVTGQREINELHLPAGQPVRILIGSEDVIHSLYFPSFRVKMDAVPGRQTVLWFTPTLPGTYRIFCAEYCGQRHSGMIGQVIVMEPREFQDWLAGGPVAANMAEAGQKLFTELACVTCHREDGQGRGPRLNEQFGAQIALTGGGSVIFDEQYIRESIVNPQGKIVDGYQPLMPTFQGLVTEEQLMQLIAYIKSLTKTASNPPQGPAAAQPAATGHGTP